MNSLRLIRPPTYRSLFKFNSVRYISQHPLKFLETQQKYQERDGLSKEWQLIYKGPMEGSLKYAVTYLTASTSIVAASALYYATFVFDISKINDPVLLGDEVVIANNPAECLIYLGAFVMFHVAVKALLSKFVIRMYKNGDDYISIFRGHWYNSTNKHHFQLNEFKKLSPTFVVSWSDARFGLGKKHGILLEQYFKTPEHFNYLLYKNKNKIK